MSTRQYPALACTISRILAAVNLIASGYEAAKSAWPFAAVLAALGCVAGYLGDRAFDQIDKESE